MSPERRWRWISLSATRIASLVTCGATAASMSRARKVDSFMRAMPASIAACGTSYPHTCISIPSLAGASIVENVRIQELARRRGFAAGDGHPYRLRQGQHVNPILPPIPGPVVLGSPHGGSGVGTLRAVQRAWGHAAAALGEWRAESFAAGWCSSICAPFANAIALSYDSSGVVPRRMLFRAIAIARHVMPSLALWRRSLRSADSNWIIVRGT